MAINFTKTNC